ncbi:MAG: hypothetical protein OEZ01_02120, partial [Candidatus Heimdallarchaeota archaeon]|nr:hypothetical protein [Candidatus Heimdallarchaeota archaeon]
YAIRRLREKGIVKKIPNLLDMRRVFYRLATYSEIMEENPELNEEETLILKTIVDQNYGTTLY